MLNRRTLLGLLAASPFLARPAFAATPAIYAEGGIAIDGSDAVAYFDGNGPVAGDAAFALMWQGAEWRFSSAENLAKFEANPEGFAPQYGGYCAYAASKGGILAMALPVARDLAREGIRCNTILPGFFETPIYEQMKPEVKESLRAHVQFPARFGTAAEYAQVVKFMVEQSYINGEYLRADAGARMPPR